MKGQEVGMETNVRFVVNLANENTSEELRCARCNRVIGFGELRRDDLRSARCVTTCVDCTPGLTDLQ
jgi:hypothetical protein